MEFFASNIVQCCSLQDPTYCIAEWYFTSYCNLVHKSGTNYKQDMELLDSEQVHCNATAAAVLCPSMGVVLVLVQLMLGLKTAVKRVIYSQVSFWQRRKYKSMAAIITSKNHKF